MLLRIIKAGPGCVYRPGQSIHMDDHRARSWIKMGIAIEMDPADLPPEVPASTHMLPPRHICACGFVAKSAAGLKAHERSCK